MTPEQLVAVYAVLCAAAFLAGGINAVAGGGTLLTFPALIAVLTAEHGDRAGAVANATSTVALLPGSLASAWGYRNELAEVKPFAVRLIPPSVVGGLIGALLLELYPKQFTHFIPWLLLVAAVLFLVQKPVSEFVKRREGTAPPDALASKRRTAALMGFQFLVAVYGGYFGAGIGILMLSALGFMRVGDLHRMNAVKTLLASVINMVSVAVFVTGGLLRLSPADPAAGGLIDWPFAGVMAVAAVAGGYVGARVARRLPAAYVRWVVVAIGFGLAGYYLYQNLVKAYFPPAAPPPAVSGDR